MLDNLTVAQSEFAEHFLCFFLFYKKVISIKFSIFTYLQIYFSRWVCYVAARVCSQDGWDTGVDRPNFTLSNSSILIEKLLGGKASKKNLAKSCTEKSLQWKIALKYF
jgi:hypothetical protein